jgi:UDPglucose 6-dehydrogenase
VGTPYGNDGNADLSYLFSALDTTLSLISLKSFKTLVIKSTVPPHTVSNKIIPFVVSRGIKVGIDLGIANNPEFLREGYCWDDFMNPDRIVIGTSDQRSRDLLVKLYSSFNSPLELVNNSTSEFIKYLSNTLLATMISFANEMSIIASHFEDIDIKNSFKVLHKDKRWGNGSMKSYVYPGCGFGGYCLPKDTQALYSLSKNLGFDSHILKNVIKTNNNMPDFIVDQVSKKIKNFNSNIGILGLSFKPNSDDVRDSPSKKIIDKLIERGFTNILAFDPIANDEFSKYFNFTNLADSLDDIIQKSDALIILTAWSEFSNIRSITNKLILDFRYFI